MLPMGVVAHGAPAHPPGPHSALIVASDTAVPGATSDHNLVATEAKDGHVFIAVPKSSTADDIEVAIGTHAPTHAVTVPSGTVAMTASSSLLFVAGRHGISSFSRSTGAVIRTWNVVIPKSLGSLGGALVYGDGRLWAIGSDGSGRKVFKITPQSSVVTALGSGKNVFTLAVGPRGVYWVRSGGHTLVRVAADGTRRTAPTGEKVSEQLSGPAAVQVVAVVGKILLVAHDYGQGFDAGLLRYADGDFKRLSDAGTNVFHTGVVPSDVGTLVLLSFGVNSSCGTTANPECVARLATKTAKTGKNVTLPGSSALSPLLGPSPAVIVKRGAHAVLVRIS
jgi:hypothetical protein